MVVGIELVDVQWLRIEDISQFEVDIEKCIYRLSGIQHPSCSRCKLVCLLMSHCFLFLLLSSPLTALSREICPLQGLLNDEPVLSFSFPHHPPGPCELNLQHSHCLRESLVCAAACASVLHLGFQKFARPQLQRHCQS